MYHNDESALAEQALDYAGSVVRSAPAELTEHLWDLGSALGARVGAATLEGYLISDLLAPSVPLAILDEVREAVLDAAVSAAVSGVMAGLGLSKRALATELDEEA